MTREQTNQEYVTSAVFDMLDNIEPLYNAVQTKFRKNFFHKQKTMRRYTCYCEILHAKSWLKQEMGNDVDLRYYSSKLMSVYLENEYQEFVKFNAEMAEKTGVFAHCFGSLIKFLHQEYTFESYVDLDSYLRVDISFLDFLLTQEHDPDTLKNLQSFRSHLTKWLKFCESVHKS